LPTAGAKNCSADSVSAANTTIWRRGTRVSALFGRESAWRGRRAIQRNNAKMASVSERCLATTSQ
jgi:hypothetical protein